MVFDGFRVEGFPTHYGDKHSAAHTDILYAGLICSIVILISCFLILVLPIFSTKLKRTFVSLLRLSLAVFIGSVIILGNFGHNWEVGSVKISSPYKAASSEEITGTLGIHVALRGINITLKGIHKHPNGDLSQERIDYNEHFSWEWAQGRFGFGYYAGRISRDFRAAVLRGLPWPILQLSEYFTFDGEGLRFGRYYRWAGWYSHLLLWAAFPIWFISCIMFRSVVRKGAILLTITGSLQLIAIIIWSTLRNPIEINVPFESEDQKGEVMLTTRFGSDYYLVLVNSLLCLIGGTIIYILDFFYPEYLCQLFDIGIQTLYRDTVITRDELKDEIVTSNPNGDLDVISSDGNIPLEQIPNNIRVSVLSTTHPYLHPVTDQDQIYIRRQRINPYYRRTSQQPTQVIPYVRSGSMDSHQSHPTHANN